MIEQLLAHPEKFEFFQAVRLMQAAAIGDGGGPAPSPGEYGGIGTDLTPESECVRFHSYISLGFPASCIVQMQRRTVMDARGQKTMRAPDMTVSFMGLGGPAGVLPRHYTSLLIERIREKDFAARDFLDLFNHRLISLFYRAWEKYRFFIGYERAARQGGADLFTRCLYSLVGLGTGALQGRMDFPDQALLHYAGHLSRAPHSAAAMEMILSDYFGVPARIRQFQGQWLYLDPADRSCMARPGLPRGLNMQMGVNIVMGERVWDVQGKFRIRLGPLTYADFCRFLPDRGELRATCQMARLHAGPEFDFDVQLVLMAREVPAARLGDASAPRLGRNCWMCSTTPEQDHDEAVFALEDV